MQDRHLIAFESRKLNDTERCYMVQKKKKKNDRHLLLLVHMEALSTRVHFVVKTDNVAISYF